MKIDLCQLDKKTRRNKFVLQEKEVTKNRIPTGRFPEFLYEMVCICEDVRNIFSSFLDGMYDFGDLHQHELVDNIWAAFIF